MTLFIGRKKELQALERQLEGKKASLVVMKGRRRVGKSTLVKEFAKGKTFISISGNPPAPGITAQDERDVFANQLTAQLGLPRVTFATWTDAFQFLAAQLKGTKMVCLFDEISWMAVHDPSFLGALKTWWDQYGCEKKGLVLILCGSISMWIEDNILCSTGFVGRISLVIHLLPLSLLESVEFLRKKGYPGSVYEMLKILSVTGGIPWYLSLIHPKESADQNIYALCFGKASQLINEFQTIFHDLFDNRGESYRKILHLLIDGMKSQAEIRTLLGFQEGGTVSRYLKHLVDAGFLSEHYQWSLKQARVGKQKLYRLSDCFIRFHLKYVEPHISRIKQGAYESVAKGQLPGWDTIMGFQVESLLLANRQFLFDAIGIPAEQVVCDNPFFQTPTTRKKGCQIDYLIQTRLQSLIVCEFKFRKHELSPAIVKEVQEKVHLLATPRGLGVATVLFHVGGVAPQVEESGFFYRVVDLRDALLLPPS